MATRTVDPVPAKGIPPAFRPLGTAELKRIDCLWRAANDHRAPHAEGLD
jgi:hypothetical protein